MKIHFIGIGGIGVSALAQYYLQKGHEIFGSDLALSEITDALAKKGVKIMVGNKAEHIQQDFDLVIYSPAVGKDNPEFVAAKAFGLKLQSYPEALGQLTRKYYTIAVSGSHGKSTTTAMTALVLIKAGLDPTVIVGTKLKEFSAHPFSSEGKSWDGSAQSAEVGGGNNFRMGSSKYLVIEACEYDDSFGNYSPKIIVVTNVDKEHLDYFKTFANVVKTFKEFIAKLPKGGFLVANKDDPPTLKASAGQGKDFNVRYFSIKQKESAKLKKMLQIPGQHNVSNALAVLAVARILGVKDEITFTSLSKYQGSWRRFEIIKTKPYILISDYGHHPNEVLATLKAAREKYPNKKLWCIFQPHQYQRTFYLLKDFIKVFRQVKIDNIIITDIYDVAGREEAKINKSISSKMLVQKIAKKSVNYMPISEAEKFVKEHIKSGEVLIIMGAGNIYRLVEKF